jgi:uncharacterized membrane protein
MKMPPWRPIRLIQGRPRLAIAIAVAVGVELVLPPAWRSTTRLLIAWNAGAWLYFALSGWLMAKASETSIRRRARLTDEGKFAILLMTILAAGAAFGAIVAQLGQIKEMSYKGPHIALAGMTVLSAWCLIHLTFALHYAHEYFDEIASTDGRSDKRGGLSFPGDGEPDYFDFLYFSFVIGVAAQTADVAVTSKFMRRNALVHCVLAFLFNSALLALTINIAASLI